ncbi:serine hydrolase [Falsibacillus albus]|uniref:Beta-lactamase class A catalytic domain-containing protein n=1 Tax=Falsibacillus albus TaxID=2478915 RepID=A0A3L7JTP4_9BACI|nr:serine hydrolase [Falsibacillus albus]RLQ94247.1 hypothetical protein D9X91_14375 [Falsibacillus albus]
MELKERIIEIIPENMQLGLCIHDSKSGGNFSINECAQFPLASLAKWITAVFALKNHASVNDVSKSIKYHVNEAYMNLNNVISDKEINQQLVEMGLDIHIDCDNKEKLKNRGTPKAIFDFLNAILTNGFLSKDETKIIMEAMKAQEDRDGFRFKSPWLHMTGGLEGVCNDVGYVMLDDRCITVVGMVKSTDPLIDWEQLEALLTEIGEIIESFFLFGK